MRALRAAFRDAHYDEVLEVTEGCAEPRLRALRARTLQRLGRAEEALAEARAAVAERRDADTLLALGEALLAAGEPHEAIALLEGQEDPRVRRVHAEALAGAGHAEQALARCALLLGELEDPLERGHALATLAGALHRAGQWAAAEARWLEALEALTAQLGEAHPDVAAALDGLGLSLRRLRQPERALSCHARALVLHRQAFGDWHPGVAGCLHAQAQALHRLGRFEEAREALSDAWAVSARVQGEDHPDALVTAFELGRMEVDCGQVEEGFRRMGEAYEALRAALGPQHPTVQAMEGWL
ncbi:MAG: tetratricopeptide repeat protein [Alphaproteobacteria bacterium]|nr:tetratricopeptide repeat protein [Alphaproteobacteria bacterium]